MGSRAFSSSGWRRAKSLGLYLADGIQQSGAGADGVIRFGVGQVDVYALAAPACMFGSTGRKVSRGKNYARQLLAFIRSANAAPLMNGAPINSNGAEVPRPSEMLVFHSMLRIASVAQGMITKGQPMIRHLPMFLSGLTAGRSLPSIAPQPFRDILPTIKQDVPNPKGKIAIFTGCLLDFVYVDIATDVVKALNMAGYIVEMPLGQACCGAPATYMGDVENAKKAAELNLNAMEAEKYDYIVSACPTCTHALRDYVDFFKDDPEMLKKAEELRSKTFDFCKLVSMLGGLPDTGDGVPMKVTYHDSCHLNRYLGVTKEQRELLKATKGVELIEMHDCDKCCGFGGSYSVKFPEMSAPILEEKINNIVASGADVVAVDCPGCLLQIRGGLDARGLNNIQVKHTAQIVVEKREKK